MPESLLTRTAAVMHREPPADDDNGVAYYVARSDDPPHDIERAVGITLADAAALGEPDVITVTIEPGDRLNS